MKYLHLQVLAVVLAACFIGTESKTCNANAECGDAAVCENSICKCVPGYVWVNNMNCLPIAAGTGEGCDDIVQCQHLGGQYVACEGHLCSCTSNAYVAAGICVRRKNLGESCEAVRECIEGPNTEAQVVCMNLKCACPSPYVPNQDNTECTKSGPILGSSCTNKEECLVVNGVKPECTNNKCTCPANYKPNAANTECNSGVRNTLSILSIVVFTALAKMAS